MYRPGVPRRLVLVAVLAAALAGCSRAPEPAAPATPATATAVGAEILGAGPVFLRLVEAINRGDRAAVEALFRPDATWERGAQCPPGQCAGLARLGQEIERDIANHHHLRVVSAEAKGDTVVASVEAQTDQTRAAGVERILQEFTVRVVDGKIALLRVANDLSDPATAGFDGRRRGQ